MILCVLNWWMKSLTNVICYLLEKYFKKIEIKTLWKTPTNIRLDQTGKAWVQKYSMMWPILVEEVDYWIEIGQKQFDIWKDLLF